jgi:tRNA modification GTPase
VASFRVEGPAAIGAVAANFRGPKGRRLNDLPADRPIWGHFGPAEAAEEVVVCVRSKDEVEVHCHGGLAVTAMVQGLLGDAGCQPMGWQEWIVTRESDPFAVAARIALADARTTRTAAILLDQHAGALRRAVDEIHAAIRAGDPGTAQEQIERLLARAPLGRHLATPWRVVVAGRPNVGKSSLINAVAGYQRSIVHAMPGTTRDAVTLETAIDGWPVELCDTAGLGTGGDQIEAAGIELARQKMAGADLVVLMFDRSLPWSEQDQLLLDAWPAALVVHNKSDLASEPGERPSGLQLSAQTGVGVEEFCRAVAARLVPDPPTPGTAVPFTAEQAAEIAALLRV